MDTPKSCKSTATTTAEAVPAQESPVFSFISNLSPIQPVKPPPVTQGFPGLNSPPLVFTSPRLNPRSKLTSIRRPQFPALSSAKLCEQNNISSNSLTAVAYESQDVHLPARVSTCDDHAESPEECTDKFLSDVVELDAVNPNNLADSSRKESENVGQSQEPTTGSNVECEYVNNARAIDEIDVAAPATAKEIKGEHQGNTLSNMSVISTNIKQGGGITPDPHPKIESQLPLDHTLTDQVHDSRTESQEVSQAGLMNQSSNLPLGSVQIGKDDESSVECTDVVLSKSVLKDMQNVEAFQHRGIRRRCLQFEDALQKAISNQPAQNPTDGERPTLLFREAPLLPSNRKQVKTFQPLYPGNINSGKNIPKRSGIGLHLNSIVTSVHAGSESVVRVKSTQMVNLSVRGKKSIPLTNSPLRDTSNSSPILCSTENASANTGEKIHEIHPSAASYSAASSTLNVKSSNNSIICSSVEDQSTSGIKRKYDKDDTDGGSEEFGLSPKKKRKKSDFNDGDGCKRCNCKKSRCLKLYCDCFAAGIYCAGPCACQECYNRSEYEDTVLETRRHIESRNPLAFAPRVVQPITVEPASSCGESGTHFTPSSARHKRGCNCKKSMCLKKYCECYQAKVGCSDGCRCEGCKNAYGQKGDYGLGSESAHARIEGSLIEKVVVSGRGLCHNEVLDSHKLTPLTPAVQSFIHGKDGSKSCSLSGKNFQSPESDLTFVAQYLISPGSPRNPDNDTSSEIAQETMDLVLYHGSSESMDEIPMVSGHQHGLTGSPAVLNPQEWANISKAQSVSGSKNRSSLSSPRWQGEPNTPMVQAGGADPHELDDTTRDDTPDILRDNPTPITAVKSSSPNKKRVSPPHAWRTQLTSSSSTGVRTGRKFILKAVPSFPPLTPCVHSKSNGSQQINDPHNIAHK